MGDRVAIRFVNGTDKSVVLFSHWGGMGFVDTAAEYIKQLKKEMKTADGYTTAGPLGRLEPATVMVDFIREITKTQKRVTSDLYLGKDQNDGDCSNNGCWTINLGEDTIVMEGD